MKKIQTFTDNNLCLKELTSNEVRDRRTTRLRVIFTCFTTGTDARLSPKERVS